MHGGWHDGGISTRLEMENRQDCTQEWNLAVKHAAAVIDVGLRHGSYT